MRLDQFENDVLIYIFTLLGALDLLRVGQVSRRLRMLSSAEGKTEEINPESEFQSRLRRQLIPMNRFFLIQVARYCLNPDLLFANLPAAKSMKPIVLFSRMRKISMLQDRRTVSALPSPLNFELQPAAQIETQVLRVLRKLENERESDPRELFHPELLFSEAALVEYFQQWCSLGNRIEYFQFHLKLAAMLGHEKIVRDLLDYSRLKRREWHEDDYKIATKMAFCNGHFDLVRKIENKYGLKADVLTFQDTLFAIKCDSVTALKSGFFPMSPIIGHVGPANYSAMIRQAVKFGSLHVLEYLLAKLIESGTQILPIENESDPDERRLGADLNLIELAALYNQVHVMDFLHKHHGFPLNEYLMIKALTSPAPDSLRYLLQKGLALPRDAIIIAADLENTALIECLVSEFRLDPAVCGEDTILQRAIERFALRVSRHRLPSATLVLNLGLIYGVSYPAEYNELQFITTGRKSSETLEEQWNLAICNLYRYLELCRGKLDLETKNIFGESACDRIKALFPEQDVPKFDFLIGKNLEILFCLMDFGRGNLSLEGATSKIDELIKMEPANIIAHFARILVAGDNACELEFEDQEKLEHDIQSFKDKILLLLKEIPDNAVRKNLSLLDNLVKKKGLCVVC